MVKWSGGKPKGPTGPPIVNTGEPISKTVLDCEIATIDPLSRYEQPPEALHSRAGLGLCPPRGFEILRPSGDLTRHARRVGGGPAPAAHRRPAVCPGAAVAIARGRPDEGLARATSRSTSTSIARHTWPGDAGCAAMTPSSSGRRAHRERTRQARALCLLLVRRRAQSGAPWRQGPRRPRALGVGHRRRAARPRPWTRRRHDPCARRSRLWPWMSLPDRPARRRPSAAGSPACARSTRTCARSASSACSPT